MTQSGGAAADFAPYLYGVDAYFNYVNNTLHGVNGRKIDLAYPLDDESNPTTDITDARTLVTTDHAFAIVGVATALFGGSTYLSKSGVPTFGYVTGPVWQGPSNFFGDYGSVIDYQTSLPQFAYAVKQLKAKNVAVIALNYPSSQDECEPAIKDFKKDFGINVAYSNVDEPLFTANFSTDVTKMIDDHVDMIISCMDAGNDIALTKEMQDQGMATVPQVWVDGYDRTLLSKEASYMQDVYLLIQHVPFEAGQEYPATFPGLQLYFNQMKSYFESAYPSNYNSYLPYTYDDVALMGWESANLFTEGLRVAGKNPTQKAVITAINKITDDVGGPTGDGVATPTNWTIAHTKDTPPACISFVETTGTSDPSTASFKLVFNKGSDPWICFPLTGKINLAKPVAPPKGTPGA